MVTVATAATKAVVTAAVTHKSPFTFFTFGIVLNDLSLFSLMPLLESLMLLLILFKILSEKRKEKRKKKRINEREKKKRKKNREKKKSNQKKRGGREEKKEGREEKRELEPLEEEDLLQNEFVQLFSSTLLTTLAHLAILGGEAIEREEKGERNNISWRRRKEKNSQKTKTKQNQNKTKTNKKKPKQNKTKKQITKLQTSSTN